MQIGPDENQTLPNTRTLSGVVHYLGGRHKTTCVLGEDGHPDPDHFQALVDTVPGTDSSILRYVTTAGSLSWYPIWTPRQPVGHYFPSGIYKLSSPASGHVAIGNYSEDDDGGGQYYIGESVLVVGGIQNAFHRGRILNGVSGHIVMGPGSTFGDPADMTVTLAENATTRLASR